MRIPRFAFVLACSLAACGDNGSTPDAAVGDVVDVTDAADVSDVPDAADVIDVIDVTDVADDQVDASRPPLPVRFSFKPGWEGVRSVEVLGSFGRADDWTGAFATMTLDGDTWRATGELQPGTYSYVFRVTGDVAAGAGAATYTRLVHDPSNLRSGRCPAGSPLATTNPANPCAILFVPQSKNPTVWLTLQGGATLGAAPAAGWLAFVERAEPSQEAFFVDRVTTGADGRFSLRIASGQYRVSLWNPTALSAPDSARHVTTMSTYLARDTDLGAVDVSMAR